METLMTSANIIVNAPWGDAEDEGRAAIKYIDLKKIPAFDLEKIKSALQAENILFAVIPCILNDSTKALVISSQDFQKYSAATAGIDLIAKSEWSAAVTDSKGNAMRYIEEPGAEDGGKLLAALKDQGITAEFKRSSLKGGIYVLAIKDEDYRACLKKQNLQATSSRTPSQKL
jgi:hypothetical protein